MTLAANALQAAAYARLTSQLGATPVYDFVPQDSAFPYVVVGETTSLAWDTKTADGQEFTVTLHAFTRGAGRKGLNALVEAVRLALHEHPLAVAGHAVAVLRCEFTQTLQEDGPEGDPGHTYHGVLRFRALLQTT